MIFENVITMPRIRLVSLIDLIKKIQTQAIEKDITEETILQSRLAPDMLPFVRQIQIVADNAKNTAFRLSKKEIIPFEDTETTLDGLIERIQKTIDILDTFSETDFVNASTIEIRLPWFPGVYMLGDKCLFAYALPNFFFHLVTAYDILRNAGFEIGKSDYMGTGLPFLPDTQK